ARRRSPADDRRCGRISGERHSARSVAVDRSVTPVLVPKLRTYASFVRVSHSVFALPFALAGALLAAQHTPITWRIVLWIVVAMVGARSAAMGFNRLVDARMDALNPRTAARELPRGAMTIGEAIAFVTIASAVFLFAAWQLNPLCLALSPVALAIVCLVGLAFVAPLGTIYLAGVAIVATLLAYEQSLVRADDLSQVKRAFDLNGYVGLLYLLILVVALYGR